MPPLSPPAASTPERLLLVKLSALGDILHTLPLAHALRQALPNTHLTWAVRESFADLLRGNPDINEVAVMPGRDVRAALRFGRTLRKIRYDVVLDAQGLLKSGVVTFLSGAPCRIGWQRNREGNRLFLTEASVPAPPDQHVVAKLLNFCDALSVPKISPQRQDYLADGEATAATALLRSITNDSPRVGLIVGASTPLKSWPKKHWIAAARQISAQNAAVVLLGGPQETEFAAAIQAEAADSIAANLVGKTDLRVLASVLARLSVVVGGDTGPTHLAAAVGTPTVGLFGVSDPAHSGTDWGPAGGIILDYATEISPPRTRRFRHPKVSDAIQRIPVAAVTSAVVDLLLLLRRGPAPARSAASERPR